MEKFPRSYRFSVGDRLVGRTLDTLEALVESAYAADKRGLQEQATRGVNSLRFLLRLSLDLKLLSADSHEFASGKLEEIGRMAQGSRAPAGTFPAATGRCWYGNPNRARFRLLRFATASSTMR